MTMQTSTTRNHESSRHGSGNECGCGGSCGCGSPADECCELECLVRPRFYCGQLLNDQDLSAVVDWVGDRLRLQRHHHGWGVVCGLNVRCDHGNPQRVIVEPGHAVSCCGDDIVVCKPEPVDLSAVCVVDDPCQDLLGWQRSDEDPAIVVKPGQRVAEAMKAAVDAEDETWDERRADLIAVDLTVHYAERPTDLRASLRHSACAAPPDCEPARILETHRFETTVVPVGSEPNRPNIKRWCDGYEKCLDVVREFPWNARYHDQRDWLIRWIDAHPPSVFCDLRQQLCDLDPNRAGRQLWRILVLLVIDCRIAHARTSCPTCRKSEGIPLARIYLRRADDGEGCRIVRIDGFAPYRRPLRLDAALPAPIGAYNVAGVVGAVAADAITTLAALDIKAETVVLRRLPDEYDELESLLYPGCEVFAAPGATVELLVAQLDEDVEPYYRVIAARVADRSGVERPRPGKPSPERPIHERPVPADDPEPGIEKLKTSLRRVDGIGPKLAAELAEQGVTIERLAGMDPDTLAEMLPENQRYRIPTILESAAELAESDGNP